jgi:class 3 adenylate cyclase/tetratricopeptide (TPR) repeat protein
MCPIGATSVVSWETLSVAPDATVTFLFTDIESSTPLWELYPEAMAEAMVVHDAILSEAIQSHGGTVVKHMGDGLFAQFEGGNPVQAAVSIEEEMLLHAWPLPQPPRLRIGMHAVTTSDEGRGYFLRDDDAFGPAVIRAARVMDCAWGGQILATSAALELNPPSKTSTVEPLGEHLLKGIDEPVALNSVAVPFLRLGPFPPPRTLSARYLNLPTPESPLIGRDAELAEVVAHLRCDRLTTLAGPGGIGKTRLAIAAASAVADDFRHGVLYVQAGGLRTSEGLLTAVEGAFGRRSYGTPAAAASQLIGFLADRRLLLVLDNVEGVDVIRSTVADLLAHCPKLSILVTARTRLRIADEWASILGPIGGSSASGLPASDTELFVTAAERAGTQIEDDAGGRAAVERICQLCGGIPLALELAAASLGPRTLGQVADELVRGRRRDEFLDAVALTFEQFWQELSLYEQEVVAALTVFDGPFTAALASAVAGASSFLLSALRERAIVAITSTSQAADDPRFQLHPVFRVQTQKRRDAPDETYNRYITVMADVLADAGARIDGPDQAEVVSALTAEMQNIRGAWDTMGQRQRFDLLERSLDGLFRFHEVMGWLDHGADLLWGAAACMQGDRDVSSSLHGRILSRFATLRSRRGDAAVALPALEQSLLIAAASNDHPGEAFALMALGRLQLQNGYNGEARISLEAARQRWLEEGDTAGLASCDLYLGRVAYQEGNMPMAADLATAASTAFEAVGDEGHALRARRELALARLLLGEADSARHLLLETLAQFERLGDRIGWAESMQCLGYASTRTDDDGEALRCFEQSLAEFRAVGVASHLAADLDNLALLALRQKNYDEAGRLLRECLGVAAPAENARIVLDACIGVVELLVGQSCYDDARSLLALIMPDPRLDRSDSGPRLDALEHVLGPSEPLYMGTPPDIASIAGFAVESLARLTEAAPLSNGD